MMSFTEAYKDMAWNRWFHVTVFFVVSQMFYTVATQQCPSKGSIYGMMLRRHTFHKMNTNGVHECLYACDTDVRCQSFNFVMSKKDCELNNRTKEARPEDFVPNEERYYMERDRKRVSLDSSILGNLDKKYLEQLMSYLNPVLVDSVRSKFVRCYHAMTDGWAASTFHSNCDGKGPTVTIIQVNNYIFGGYTNVAWDSSCRNIPASKAFLYSLFNSRGYSPVKLIQYQNPQQAMRTCPADGPTFGAGKDILISNNASSNSRSHTKLGGTYLPPSNCSYLDSCSRSFLAGKEKFTPTDYEVFYETTS